MTEEVLDMEIDAEQLEVDESLASVEMLGPGTPEPVDPIVEEPIPANVTQSSESKKQHFDGFLQNLANCVNKELIDSAAIDFLLNFNTKNNRKKLTRILFGIQR